MDCCSFCGAAQVQFNPRVAEGDLRRYLRRGPNRTTQLLVDELRRAPVKGAQLLDVGGGIGAIGQELLGLGLERATLVEAAPAYVAVAEAEYARRGWADQVRVLPGDYVTLPESAVSSAELVTLDQVVCCYPEYQPLLERAARHTRRLLGLSYPRDRWYVRLVVSLQNLARRLVGNPFRTFVHPARRIAAVLEGAGLRPVARRGTLVWVVDVYQRGESVA